jgi:2',3'-cyclic-nucleotide 2'-phosphodiesterase (5'-nucleotidase family)
MKAIRLAISILIVIIAVALAQRVEAATARITFILVSDIYQMNEQRRPDGSVGGGFARLAALVKAERAKNGPVILVHAGDTLSPSLMSGLDRGAHIVDLTNMIAPDVFVPGNHEFDFGQEVFLKRMEEAKFPLYAANLRGADGRPLPGFKDRAILTFSGVRIGIVGATYDDTPRVADSGSLQFSPIIDTIKREAETLRREGADFIVAVVHASRGQDYALNATGAADLILSGHDHDLFINYEERSAMAESSYDANMIAIVEVAIEVNEAKGRRTTAWRPQFRVVDTATVSPDPEVAAAIATYEGELSREMDEPLATTAVALDSRNATVRAREAAIGNLFTDAMRASAKTDVALINGGNMRGGRVYTAGSPITRRNVLEELPFNNRVVTIEVAGKELRRAIETGLRSLPDAAGWFPQVSGMTIEADGSRPPGQRVLSIKVGRQPLDDARTYTVATNDFLARGGDGYDMLRDAKRILQADDSPLIANEAMAYLRRVGTVRTGVEGRIVLK